MNTFGQNIRICIFGESHGPLIGLTIDGLPAGLNLNMDKIHQALKRRKGSDDISTPRREDDEIRIVSGYFNQQTTGAPLTFTIANKKYDSSNYEYGLIRPSHADYPLYQKFNFKHDYLGGGHSSGRLTAVLVVLGSICEEILHGKKIHLASRIYAIKDVLDQEVNYNEFNQTHFNQLKASSFPVINPDAKKKMIASIKHAQASDDSVGGIIETFVTGLPIGLGEPFFNSVESIIAHLMFSIPGVKAIEFGEGFNLTKGLGSEVNDQMQYQANNICFSSNHQGGINGGMTNGLMLNFKVGVKPPSSIKKPQQMINIIKQTNEFKQIKGQHDACFVHRALPVVEALTAYGILDLLMEAPHAKA